MRQITYQQWLDEGQRLFGPARSRWQFVCPSCGTVQTAQDFYAAGFLPLDGEVARRIGHECIGNHNGWPGKPPRSGNIPGCKFNFSVHGQQLCQLEILVPGEAPHPRFEFALPQQAATPPRCAVPGLV